MRKVTKTIVIRTHKPIVIAPLSNSVLPVMRRPTTKTRTVVAIIAKAFLAKIEIRNKVFTGHLLLNLIVQD